MSRYPVKEKILDESEQGHVDVTDGVSRQREGEIAAQARAVFADQATTAVALCGLDAWFDGKTAETGQWARILRRLGH